MKGKLGQSFRFMDATLAKQRYHGIATHFASFSYFDVVDCQMSYLISNRFEKPIFDSKILCKGDFLVGVRDILTSSEIC